MSNSDQAKRVLDATGLFCPMPLLKTRLELSSLRAGEVISVMATDPSSWVDIRKYVSQSEHELVEAFERDGSYCIVIRKGVRET